MVTLTESLIDETALIDAVQQTGHGAVLVFRGVTRDNFDGRGVVHLEYEAYGPMALREMQGIVDAAESRWAGVRVAMTHRIGLVPLGEASIVIAVGAAHRGECYDASRFAIDTLKETVPIWKKEIYADGSAWKANASVTEHRE